MFPHHHYYLVISPLSAKILADAFKNNFDWISQFILPLLSLITTIAAATIAVFSYKTQRDSFINGILDKFFDITTALPMSAGAKLTSHHKQLICNYFETVCTHLKNKKLSEKDIEPCTAVLRQSDFVDFAKNYRQRHGNEYFENYIGWVDSH